MSGFIEKDPLQCSLPGLFFPLSLSRARSPLFLYPSYSRLLFLCRSKKESNDDLLAVIAQRRGERKAQLNSLLSSIITKCNGSEDPEPSEEEFQKARKRLEQKQKSKKRKN